MTRWGAVTALALALLGSTAVAASDRRVPPAHGDALEVVVVLHGLGRDADSMSALAGRVRSAGYRVVPHEYPSTRATIDELVTGLGARLTRCCRDAPRLHFVTYSLGGVVVRAFLAKEKPANLGRVVMIAPPNRGSEWVDELGQYAVFERAYGPVGSDLGTGEASLPNRLGPADFELGVVAGTRAVNPVGSLLIPGDDDGTVAVENTKLAGMSDFIALPHSHTFIMNAPAVARATLRFLATGRFRSAAPEAAE